MTTLKNLNLTASNNTNQQAENTSFSLNRFAKNALSSKELSCLKGGSDADTSSIIQEDIFGG